MENSMDIIYKITSPSKKVYIGRTSDLGRRINEHRSVAKKQEGWSLHKSIRKYGWDNMVVEELAKVIPAESQVMEEALILKHDSVRNGYNDTYMGYGGDQWAGRYDTKEYKAFVDKMTKLNSGYKNPMYGKSQTEETKSKMRKKAKGRFSLPWYQDRHGVDEGTELYQARCLALKNRKLKKDQFGRFKSN
jgi:group I intron endonuclease